jgi:hypothetical protein
MTNGPRSIVPRSGEGIDAITERHSARFGEAESEQRAAVRT